MAPSAYGSGLIRTRTPDTPRTWWVLFPVQPCSPPSPFTHWMWQFSASPTPSPPYQPISTSPRSCGTSSPGSYSYPFWPRSRECLAWAWASHWSHGDEVSEERGTYTDQAERAPSQSLSGQLAAAALWEGHYLPPTRMNLVSGSFQPALWMTG